MADNVQWLKIKVGMFDGFAFKKMKHAIINGNQERDKLTAIWFELLDLAGQCNNKGYIINDYSDIAAMLDRNEDEIRTCMEFFINAKMIIRENGNIYINKMGFKENNTYILDCGDKRTSQRYKQWRLFVLDRDNYTCQECGKKSSMLIVHHIVHWAKSPEDRFNVDNGITLCNECHKKIHYGGKKCQMM